MIKGAVKACHAPVAWCRFTTRFGVVTGAGRGVVFCLHLRPACAAYVAAGRLETFFGGRSLVAAPAALFKRLAVRRSFSGIWPARSFPTSKAGLRGILCGIPHKIFRFAGHMPLKER